MTDLLQIDGWTEHTGDWELGAGLDKAHPELVIDEFECVQNCDDGAVNLTAVKAVKATGTIAAYSLGVASLWDVTGGWKRIPSGQRFGLGIIVAGCLDWMKGQFSGWHAPACFDRFYCFQVTPDVSFPVSNALIGAVWFDIRDPNLKALLRANPVANINCDVLAQEIGGGPIGVHSNIQNHPEVLAVMQWMVEEFGMGAGGETTTNPPPNTKDTNGDVGTTTADAGVGTTTPVKGNG